MAAVRVIGSGPAAEAALQALAAPTAARPVGDLLVVVPPAGVVDPVQALAQIHTRVVTLAEAVRAALPPPARDADGELRASATIALVVNRAALAADPPNPAEAVATATLLAWMRGATLRFGPQLRLNALALDLAVPGDLSTVLHWLSNAHAVAGQVIGGSRPSGGNGPLLRHRGQQG